MDLLTVLEDHLLKTKKEYKNLKKQGIHDIFIKTNWIKPCFQQDMGYGNFEDLPIRGVFDTVLRDKELNIAKNPKNNEYQR